MTLSIQIPKGAIVATSDNGTTLDITIDTKKCSYPFGSSIWLALGKVDPKKADSEPFEKVTGKYLNISNRGMSLGI